MPLPHVVNKRTSALNKQFDKCMAKLERLEASGRYDEYDALREQELSAIYKSACGLVQDADKADASYCDELLDAVQAIIDEGGGEAGDMYLGPATEHGQTPDPNENLVVEDLRPHIGRGNDLPQPHPKSSPYATFRPNLPELTAMPDDHFARYVYEARCEISSVRDIKDRLFGSKEDDSVVDLQLSADGSCLAVVGSIKNRSKYTYPWIACHYPDDAQSRFTDLMKRNSPLAGRFDIGLAGIPRHMTMDDGRRLILVGDSKRIKSFAWGTATGTYYKKPRAKFTLDSDGFVGPILSLNGRVLRAGKGSAAVWAIERIKDHGPKGNSVVGKRLMVDDEYDRVRDENPYIEPSSGAPPTSRLTFANKPNLQPNIWKLLPESASTALCTERTGSNCITMDLEHGGTTTARFKGHSSPVTHVSTSTADPRVFLTSSSDDEYARFFDVRYPNPVVHFKAQTHGGVGPVALGHPDGIPTVFTGGDSYQDFKVWDLRARACVYDLGMLDECDTFMHSLAWDSGRNTLYSWKSVFEDGASDYSESGEGLSAYNRIVRYAFKDKPRYSMLPPDNPKVNEAEYYEEEYDTDVPLDDSDEDYVD